MSRRHPSSATGGSGRGLGEEGRPRDATLATPRGPDTCGGTSPERSSDPHPTPSVNPRSPARLVRVRDARRVLERVGEGHVSRGVDRGASRQAHSYRDRCPVTPPSRLGFRWSRVSGAGRQRGEVRSRPLGKAYPDAGASRGGGAGAGQVPGQEVPARGGTGTGRRGVGRERGGEWKDGAGVGGVGSGRSGEGIGRGGESAGRGVGRTDYRGRGRSGAGRGQSGAGSPPEGRHGAGPERCGDGVVRGA